MADYTFLVILHVIGCFLVAYIIICAMILHFTPGQRHGNFLNPFAPGTERTIQDETDDAASVQDDNDEQSDPVYLRPLRVPSPPPPSLSREAQERMAIPCPPGELRDRIVDIGMEGVWYECPDENPPAFRRIMFPGPDGRYGLGW